MSERLIRTASELGRLCRQIRKAGIVAFDTEFVSEYSYRPQLCLLQFATPETAVAVDPLALPQLDPWWELMTDEKTTVVVHGGREEIRFCLEATGQPPRRIVDIQIAEGLRSRSYPLAYTALVSRVLGRSTHRRETRTDWRRRPLSKRQIEYALEDVVHILPIWERQRESLVSLGRLSWAEDEFRRAVDELVAERTREPWRKLSGLHRLTPRELAVVRELFRWRSAEAEREDKPERRVLRDDLLLELAHRQPTTVDELLATRGMDRPYFRRLAKAMLQAIEVGRAVPEEDCPPPVPRPEDGHHREDHVLGKLLAIALANRCAEVNVAMPLLGGSADLRELVRWHVRRKKQGEPPLIAQGWRAEVCGNLLEDVLDGKLCLRVADPTSDHPLVFEPAPARKRKAASRTRGRKPKPPT